MACLTLLTRNLCTVTWPPAIAWLLKIWRLKSVISVWHVTFTRRTITARVAKDFCLFAGWLPNRYATANFALRVTFGVLGLCFGKWLHWRHSRIRDLQTKRFSNTWWREVSWNGRKTVQTDCTIWWPIVGITMPSCGQLSSTSSKTSTQT